MLHRSGTGPWAVLFEKNRSSAASREAGCRRYGDEVSGEGNGEVGRLRRRGSEPREGKATRAARELVSGFWWTDGRSVGQAIKCTRWMPRHEPATKDVASCEKPRGAASEQRSGDIRMGQPEGGHTSSLLRESQPRELKHLSTWRKRNQNEILLVAASERGRAQPRGGKLLRGLRGPEEPKRTVSGTRLERRTGGGESPVRDTRVEC